MGNVWVLFELIDFFLEVRGVGRVVAGGSVLGDGIAVTGGEIVEDRGQVLVGRATVGRWAPWD